MQILQSTQHTKYIQQPDHNNDHYYGIKNAFDGTLHWDVRVHQPEKNSNNNEDNDNS